MTRSDTKIAVVYSCLIGITYGFSIDLFSLLIPDMRTALKFSYVEAGLIVSMARAGFLVASLMANWLAVTLGTGRTICLSVFGTIMAQSGMGLCSALWQLYSIAFIFGFSSAATYIPMVAEIGKRVPYHSRAKVFGIISSGQSYAVFACGFVVPLLATQMSWRGIWLAFATLSLILLLCAMNAVGMWSTAEVSKENIKATTPPPTDPLGSIVTLRVCRIWLVIFLSGACTFPFQAFLSTFVQEELIHSTSLVGVLWALIGFVGMWGGFVTGAIADRWGTRISLCLCYLAMLAASILLVWHPGVVSLAGAAALYGFAFYSIYGLLPAYISKSFGPVESVRIFGIANVLLGVSTAIAGVLAGWYKDSFNSFEPVYAAIAFLSFCLIVITNFIEPDGSSKDQPGTDGQCAQARQDH